VPHFSRAGGSWVRANVFRDAGIDYQTGLDIAEKVRDACLQASKPDSQVWGWGMTANRSGDGESLVMSMVMFSGGQLTDETGQVVVLNQEPYREGAIAGLTFLKDLYTNPRWTPMLPPGVGAWTDTSNNEAYLAGKILYTANAGTLYASALVSQNPVAQDTYMIAPFTGVGPGARVLQGAADSMNWYVMKGAKNREAAEQLIRYLVSKDIQQQLFRISTGYVYPAYTWGWDEPIITENQGAQHVTPVWKSVAFDPSGFTSGEWPGPPTPWTASLEASNFWTDMFGEVLTGKPIDAALADAHARAVQTFKEFGAKGA
jgi:multiple sugar transport system substrate-binding protein